MAERVRAETSRHCSECGTTPADHYCSTCGKFFCGANGCGQGERGHHPTTHKPQLVSALQAVDSREALRDVLRPVYDEHQKHKDPRQHRECPFCTGDIT
jgi:hypothetical protein